VNSRTNGSRYLGPFKIFNRLERILLCEGSGVEPKVIAASPQESTGVAVGAT
jgi:hypothetical protein